MSLRQGPRYQFLFLCFLVTALVPDVVTSVPVPAASAVSAQSLENPRLISPSALLYFPEFQRVVYFAGNSSPSAAPILSSLDLSKPFPLASTPSLPATHEQLATQAQSEFLAPWTGANNQFAFLGNDHGTIGRLVNGGVAIESVSELENWSTSSTSKFSGRPSYSMVATASHGVDIVDSKTYIFGRDSQLLVFDSDKSLKPVSPSSSSRPPPRRSASLIRIDSSRLLLSGGFSEDAANTPLADNWVYDLTASTWTQIANLASGPRQSHQSAVVRPASQSYIVHLGGQEVSSVIEYSVIPRPGTNSWAWRAAEPAASFNGHESTAPLLAIHDQLLIFNSDATLTGLKVTETTPGTLSFAPLDTFTPPSTSPPSVLEQTSGPVSATTMIIVAGVCVGIIGLVFALGVVWSQRQHPHDTNPLTGMFYAHDGDQPLRMSFEPLALPRPPPGAHRTRMRTNSLPVQPVPTAWSSPSRRRTLSTGRRVTFQVPHTHSEPVLHVPRSPGESGSLASLPSLGASAPLLSARDEVEGPDSRPKISRSSVLKHPAAAPGAVSGSGPLSDQDFAVDAPVVRRKCERSVSWRTSTGVHGREDGKSGRPVLHASDVDESILEESMLVGRPHSPKVVSPVEDRGAPSAET